jgi:hypothetical protein
MLLMAAATFVISTPAFAQSPSAPRQAGGLFGDTRSDTADRHRLNIAFGLLEALDRVPPPGPGSALVQPGLLADGYSTTLVGSAEYARTRRRTQLAGTAQTAFRYYQSLNDIESVSHSAGLGASFQLPRTATVRFNQSAAYSPSYLYELFPAGAPPTLGEAIPAPPDYRVLQAESYSYRSDAAFAMGTSRGPRVSVSGHHDRTDFTGQPTVDPTWITSGARAEVASGRKVAFIGAYEYRMGDFALGGLSKEHRLDFGMDYSRALSSGRRAAFRFKITPSTLDTDGFRIGDQLAGRVFRTQGQASVDYYSRRWHASGQVERAVEYVALLAAPVLADSSRFSLQGLLNRRMDLLAMASYATGASVVNVGHEVDAYTANIRLRFAFSRTFALYTEYLHFYYDLRGQQGLSPDLPREYQQRSIKVGLTLWASVF